ncbi:MAG: hypothetical protein MI746_11850 [Pseudomonadales bacterium]|nr:hypothetical protein [Pseudomonadales bacterium]
MLKKIAKVLAGLVVTLIFLGVAVYIATGPQQPNADSSSAQWLTPGPHRVASRNYRFVDESRPTAENRGVPGKPNRTLTTTLWYPEGYPEDIPDRLPLIIHSHGIVSERTELAYVAEALASRGYVVAAANYPLTSGETEGGANANDVVNQPGDISFLIDSILALAGGDKPFVGDIDETRIGLTGYSLGGLTTYLTTYHANWREPRIAAAVAIAGPSAPFAPEFFSTTNIPFLAIAGTADALIEYRRNAQDIPQRSPQSQLITIEGGTHLGFTGISEPYLRFMDNPDSFACYAVLGALDGDPNEPLQLLGGEDIGVDLNRELPSLCDYGFPSAAHPGRQQMITQLAIVSFLESVFNPDSETREQASEQLTVAIASDFSEASYVD